MTVDTRSRSATLTSMRGRSFLKELDFSGDELRSLIDLAAELKADAKSGREKQRLKGKKIALVFEKTSTRTRCAFEVAAYDQGAHVTYLGPDSSQIGQKESIKDTARVLGRMFDAIEYRGFGQDVVEQLGQFAGVPVYNGLSNEFHPTQMLADVLTMREHSEKPLNSIAFCYIGDARFNTGNSLMITGSKLGMQVSICAPESLQPDPKLVATAREIADQTGASVTVDADIDACVRGVDFISTDVWLSIQVKGDLLRRTGNPQVKFMHCLPAFHDRATKVGAEIYRDHGLSAVEVTDDVFESDRSIVFDEAENRLHTIKAVMVATLGA